MADGIVCQKCGTTEKRESGKCRQCAALANREYRKRHAEKLKKKRAENKEKASAYAKQYYAKNSEKLKARSAARLEAKREEINALERARYKPEDHWRKNNPERHGEWVKKYVAENRAKRCAYEANRRARKAAGGELPVDAKDRLYALQKGRCACCRSRIDCSAHLDHIAPLADGGLNTFENVQLLCPACNLAKNRKDPIEFMQSRGYLL